MILLFDQGPLKKVRGVYLIQVQLVSTLDKAKGNRLGNRLVPIDDLFS